MVRLGDVLGVGGAIAGLIAAWLWLVSSRLHVRDNQDEFINDLHAIERANFRAAIATAISALLIAAAEIVRDFSHP